MVYENILKLCNEKGISISALEKSTGIGNGTIKRWETSNPRVDLLKKVCDYFSVSVDEVLKK